MKAGCIFSPIYKSPTSIGLGGGFKGGACTLLYMPILDIDISGFIIGSIGVYDSQSSIKCFGGRPRFFLGIASSFPLPVKDDILLVALFVEGSS